MISGFINRGAIAGTTRSAKVSFAHSRLNYSAGIDSQLILVPVEPSVSTATSSSTHQRRFQPTDRSVQSCSNYAGNHANSRSSQPVHEMRANSLAELMTQTRLLLQQERCDQLVRLGRVHVAAVDRQPVITTDEFVVDNLPIAIGVLHEGRRIAVCAVPRNARSIGQLRAS